ncbi:CPBP family intramembrane glutamic endopeptidase [Gemmatimonas groenlandica]|uniref:CPBP family intramembrane metalloprotease n=1 Tax=Gemmatimonas groenlandica TaxID=2732249 RepID=A0A6M4INX7_9BACT|nr:CPBP family intramembrane glutamic endopeptidase [Gemmatimonas groenlandica]QJR35439.1 CPBP family intramembrane metalloprotease [Gemmatimonas groenlandica]
MNKALRVPWRLLSFGVAWILAQGIAESVLGPLFGLLSRRVGETVPMYPFTMLIGVAAACYVALRFVDDVPWSVMALGEGAWQGKRMAIGVLLGTVAILGTAGVLWAVGALRMESTPTASIDGAMVVQDSWGGTALRLLLLLGPAALWEELVFRGYLYAVAEEAAGLWVARLSSSVAFGAVHLMNPGANVRTTVVVMLAGLCLCLVRERTESLPAAWTAHLAWNWVMAAVLHVPVSGLPFATPGYRAVPSGSEWISGGAWGPEGGLVAMLVLGGSLAVGLRRRESRAET